MIEGDHFLTEEAGFFFPSSSAQQREDKDIIGVGWRLSPSRFKALVCNHDGKKV